MFIITAFFSSILIGFSLITRQRVAANQLLRFERAVLQAFSRNSFSKNQQVHQIFTEQFEMNEDRTAPISIARTARSPVMRFRSPDRVSGTISKVSSVSDADKTLPSRASHFTSRTKRPVWAHGSIEEEFRKQFIGKKIKNSAEPIGIKFLRPAQTLDENEVHAITGATQTSIRLEVLMNQDLRQWLDAMQNQEPTP